MFSKSARKVCNEVYLFTNDKIVKSLTRNWILHNSYYKSLYKLFGIKIKKRFKVKIRKEKMKSGTISTLFELSCGIFNTNKFIIREC